MNPESYDEDGVQWAWDSTSLKRADACQRLYYYQNILGWEPQGQSVHLWFGGIYASALELYHKLVAQGSTREEAIREAVKSALITSWDFEKNEATFFDDQNKNRDTLIRTIIWYFEFFKEEVYHTYITADGTPAVEFSFQLPVDNNVTFCGHADRIVVEDATGELFTHDQKTTKSTLGPYFFKKYKPDIQFAMYTFAGQAIYHAPVKGVVVDAAQVAVGFSRYARAPVLFIEAELNEWYDEMMELIKRTRENTRRGHFPRTPASCNNFGGCPFREVCSRPPSVRENFLRGDFKKVPRWDPVKAR